MDTSDQDQGSASQDTLDGLDGQVCTTYEDKFTLDPYIPGLFHCVLYGKTVCNRWHHVSAHFPREHRCLRCVAVYNRVDKLKTHLRNVRSIEMANYSRGPHFEPA
ncbi:Sex determination protein fruitless [Zootermopsis nevadensis]|uniref:Sex determination protein fruitless n=1 Tax=Zootermopsis nevadensis TaxID=136037 RepID=A0A067R5P2_ZOONE|nr:Sex determination protein fruitless [Zootermopsis nevadensis]